MTFGYNRYFKLPDRPDVDWTIQSGKRNNTIHQLVGSSNCS